MSDLEDRYSIAINSAELTMRNLVGMENSGDGALIHDCRHFQNLLVNGRANLDYYRDTGNIQKYEELLVMYERFILHADQWLNKVAKGL